MSRPLLHFLDVKWIISFTSKIAGAAHCGLEDFLSMATNIAGALGTKNSGQIPRGNGCVINWSFQGMLAGIEWKYMGVCTDSCTHETETVFKQSRGGAVEHCLHNLMRKIARHGDL
ncbi:uncharacterized protein LOC123550974 isoform X2 [Mercenaria mercenaria]|uniref:uncharacterized protein LOC123550974 isoform X2 n=1 Tax=Mercenaria mercenaria TaxID=6596 RepID=UPI00234F6673|nr:uncharacterized protein LOC123550974 isoform X2 [Mercenaria mercenaria]